MTARGLTSQLHTLEESIRDYFDELCEKQSPLEIKAGIMIVQDAESGQSYEVQPLKVEIVKRLSDFETQVHIEAYVVNDGEESNLEFEEFTLEDRLNILFAMEQALESLNE